MPVWIPLYYLLIFLVGFSSCKNLCQSHHSNVVFSMFVNFISEQFWFISQFCWLKYINCLVITTYFCWLTPQNPNQVDPRISWLANYWQCSAIYCKYNVYIYCIYWKKTWFQHDRTTLAKHFVCFASGYWSSHPFTVVKPSIPKQFFNAQVGTNLRSSKDWPWYIHNIYIEGLYNGLQ